MTTQCLRDRDLHIQLWSVLLFLACIGVDLSVLVERWEGMKSGLKFNVDGRKGRKRICFRVGSQLVILIEAGTSASSTMADSHRRRNTRKQNLFSKDCKTCSGS